MAFTSRQVKTRETTQKSKDTCEEITGKEEHSDGSEKRYKWFLASLIIIVLGAASINQIFLLFIKLPAGLNFTDPEMSAVLTAWTVGGMIASLTAGGLSDKIGRSKVMLLGLALAVVTPLLYSVASNVPLMAMTYGLNGVSFWIIQTAGFVLAGDLIPKHRRGRLLSRYNTVMALSWGPAGILIGGPLADIQVKTLGLAPHAAYVNAFYLSSIILMVGTLVFVARVARLKLRNGT